MLDTFRFGVADLQEHVRQFIEHHRRKEGHQIARDRERQRIIAAVRRDVLAVSAAAGALVAHARRITCVPEAAQEAERRQAFDPEQHAFVVGLRNNLSHVVSLEADWKVTYTPSVTDAAFEFDSSTLLAEGKFTESARSFIGRMSQKIDVAVLFEDYSRRVERFYQWFREEIETHLPVDVADYRRCVRAHRAWVARTTWRLFLHAWIDRGVEPYAHLADYLESEALEEILCLPHRSAVQVERIIELVDRDGICDEELRSLVFRLFKVNQS